MPMLGDDVADAERERLDEGAEHPRGDHTDVVVAGLHGTQDHELVTARPRHALAVADDPAQPVADGDEQLVARTVAPPVVEDLEAVEVEEEHGEDGLGLRVLVDRAHRAGEDRAHQDQHADGQDDPVPHGGRRSGEDGDHRRAERCTDRQQPATQQRPHTQRLGRGEYDDGRVQDRSRHRAVRDDERPSSAAAGGDASPIIEVA